MSRPAPARTVVALCVDLVLVVLFAVIGYATHHGAVDVPGLADTAWPFVVALAAGWAATLAWRAPTAPLRTGLPLWAITVAGGMLLRVVTGGGTAIAFVIVTAVVLLAFLVGWRAIAAAVARLRSRGHRAG